MQTQQIQTRINVDALTPEQRNALLHSIADFMYEFNYEGFLETMMDISFWFHESEEANIPKDTTMYVYQVRDLVKEMRQHSITFKKEAA
jgi:hypothetical protein